MFNWNLLAKETPRDEYELLIESFGLADRIQLNGYVSRDQIADFYRGADVFVLPSYNEGYECGRFSSALSSGLPIVSADRAGGEKLVEEGKWIYI